MVLVRIVKKGWRSFVLPIFVDVVVREAVPHDAVQRLSKGKGGTSVRACLSSRGIIVGFCPADDSVGHDGRVLLEDRAVGGKRLSDVVGGNTKTEVEWFLFCRTFIAKRSAPPCCQRRQWDEAPES